MLKLLNVHTFDWILIFVFFSFLVIISITIINQEEEEEKHVNFILKKQKKKQFVNKSFVSFFTDLYNLLYAFGLGLVSTTIPIHQ